MLRMKNSNSNVNKMLQVTPLAEPSCQKNVLSLVFNLPAFFMMERKTYIVWLVFKTKELF